MSNGIDIKVEVKNIDRIIRVFRIAPEITAREVKVALQKSITLAQSKSKMGTPVGQPPHGTGFLRARQPISYPGPLSAKLTIEMEYGIYVHEGTKFMQARPWLKEAIPSIEGDINRFFNEALANISKQL